MVQTVRVRALPLSLYPAECRRYESKPLLDTFYKYRFTFTESVCSLILSDSPPHRQSHLFMKTGRVRKKALSPIVLKKTLM